MEKSQGGTVPADYRMIQLVFTLPVLLAKVLVRFSRKELPSYLKAMRMIMLAKDFLAARLSFIRLEKSTCVPEENTVVGNVILYGAISGEAYFNGKAGERFAIRNSGATAVVESIGAHGCEYMTNGIVVVLGQTGKNFAAGMSGGFAYVLDETGEFAATQCNRAMVDIDSLDVKDELMVKQLVEKHSKLTASPRARLILDQWDKMIKKFVKIFPHDYKRVLNISKEEQKKKKILAATSKEVSHG